MLIFIGLLIIISMAVIILLPFNDKFWIYINNDKKRGIANFTDYSDYELDLYSIINDYQSGVLDNKEFHEKVNSFHEIINNSSIDNSTRMKIEQLLEDVNAN